MDLHQRILKNCWIEDLTADLTGTMTSCSDEQGMHFMSAAHELWNNISSLHKSKTVYNLKSGLKSHLLKRAFNL